MAAHGRGLDLAGADRGAHAGARSVAHHRRYRQPDEVRHRVRDAHRRARGRGLGHVGARPGAHHRGRDRRGHGPGRSHPSGTAADPARGRRRRARAPRAYRGCGRPRAPRGVEARRRDLRDHEGGRRAWRVCRTCERYARRHGLRILRIADLIAYRRNERQVRRRAETTLPTRKAGNFRLLVYGDNLETQAFVALVKGDGASRPAGAGAAAFAVPDRRRVRVAALRLRRAARRGAGRDGAGRQRRSRLHVRRGARHRAPEQDSRLRAAGPGPRHRGSQPRARDSPPTCATTRPACTYCSTSACGGSAS